MRAALLLPFAMLLLSGSPAPALAAGAGAAPRTHVVVIDKMKFGPVPAGIHAGDTILWVNRDIFRHTATARNGSFSIDLAPKAQGRTVVAKPGKIAFYCKYHPGMTGALGIAAK
jgi:plastocyanin